jgi:hypothetical protein
MLLGEGFLRLADIRPREYVPEDVRRSRWWTDYPAPGDTLRYVGWLPFNVKEFDIEVSFNAAGWRDRDYGLEKRKGVYRIIVIGDSYVEAREVELEKTFHKILESRLNQELDMPVEVMALGRGGTTTVHHYEYLKHSGLALDPDLVILSFFPGNDVIENSAPLSQAYRRWLRQVYTPYVVEPKARIYDCLLWVRGSYLNHFVVDRLLDFYTNNAHLFHSEISKEDLVSNSVQLYRPGDYDTRWAMAWKRSLALIDRMRTLAEGEGVEFLLMIAHSGQVPGIEADPLARNELIGVDTLKPIRILSEFSEEREIAYLNLEPPLTKHFLETGERYFWKYDAHWNETGHRVVADALFRIVAPKVAGETPVQPPMRAGGAPAAP